MKSWEELEREHCAAAAHQHYSSTFVTEFGAEQRALARQFEREREDARKELRADHERVCAENDEMRKRLDAIAHWLKCDVITGE